MGKGNGQSAKPGENHAVAVSALSESSVTQAVSSETKYELSKLRENCLPLFGVTTSIFDGATEGVSGQQTIEKTKRTIDEWSGKELRV